VAPRARAGRDTFDAMAVVARGEVVQRIVERTDLDAFAERLPHAFWDSPEFQQLAWLHRRGGANP
jgi:hypothetical protein